MEQHFFIGIPMPASIHSVATMLQQKHQLQNHYKIIPKPEDFHITLVYIGPLSSRRRLHLEASLMKVSQQLRPFTISITSLHYFGSPQGPRVVYLAPAESAELLHLQQEVASLAQISCAIELPATFTPHVTIAKKRRHLGATPIQPEHFSPIQVTVTDFRLFQIHPHASPKYEAVSIFTLANH